MLSGDTSVFAKSLEERADDYRQWAKRGQEAGALHHRFALGGGFVLLIDEWESADAFQRFSGDPNVATEIIMGKAVDSPDRY